MKFSYLILFMFIIPSSVWGMQKPFDFGDVPKEQLEKEVYSIDSTANAVVLFDVGETYVDSDLEVRFKRHVRIKVLSDTGLKEGDIGIGFREDDPEQGIRDLDVVTYNLNEKGKVKEQKLGRRDKFEEEVSDNWSRLKFSVPGLKKGSVFEYRYEIISESSVDIRDWQFQKHIPVLWSEYSVSIPEWFDYLSVVKSFYPLEKQNQSQYHGNARIRYSSTQGPSGMGGTVQRRATQTSYVDFEGTKYEWAMKDLPAIVDESYINSTDDYSAKVLLQLNSYRFPGSMRESVLTNWLDLIEILEESEYFGERIKPHSLFEKTVKEVVSEDQTAEEKLIILYNHVRDRMTWNDEYQLLIDDRLDKIYEQGDGNGSEINMILVQMLREAGIQADPVILSTRSNGQVLDIFPIIEQFNHAIAVANIEGKEYLLDASLKNKPFHLLPIQAQNGSGLVVNSENFNWKPLINNEPAKSTELVTVSINADGSIKGKLESKHEGYFSYSQKEHFEGEDSLEVVKEYVFDNDDRIIIDSVSINRATDHNTFNYEADFKYTKVQDTNPTIIYFNPFLLNRISENPFSKEKREYPVDFNFPFSKQMVLRISTPEGWVVDEMPESKIVRLPQGMGEFRRIIQPAGDLTMMVYLLKMNSYKVMPDNYSYLRELFQEIVTSMNENIVLKKAE